MNTMATRQGNDLWIQHEGRIYRVYCGPEKRVESGKLENELLAPFSCKVVKLHVSSGQKISCGDAVVSVEAMKMEYTYDSPRDGTVDMVLVKEGEVLEEGTLFVRWKIDK